MLDISYVSRCLLTNLDLSKMHWYPIYVGAATKQQNRLQKPACVVLLG